MATKTYSKISELLQDTLPDDPKFAQEFQEQVQQRQLVRRLAMLRNERGVSQQAVADQLGCKQGRISKLENGLDADLSIGEIEAYAKALNYDVELVVRNRDRNIADEVRYHALRIKSCFEELTELAQHDEDVARGVAKFHVEALINLVEIVRRSAMKLPKGIASRQRVHMEIEASEENQASDPISDPPAAEHIACGEAVGS